MARVEDLEEALRRAAASQPPVTGDVAATIERASSTRPHREHRRVVVGAIVLVGAIGVAALVVRSSDDTGVDTGPASASDDTGVDTGPASAGMATEWEQLPASPLSPRTSVEAVWTGDELLIVGGDAFLCPPNASCMGPEDPPFADGAALDTRTETWRSIAPAPIPISGASTAVLGDDVYFLINDGFSHELAVKALLRYSITDDTWVELPLPPGERHSDELLATDDAVIAYASGFANEQVPDLLFDPTTSQWSPLPADPLGPSVSHSLLWVSPHLYLFESPTVPSTDFPNLTRAARLDLARGTWEQLPDSEILGGPGFVEGNLLVGPSLNGADGGEVNGWGRWYPEGGIFDTSTQTWTTLPPAPRDDYPEGLDFSAGVLGTSDAQITQARGLVLDLTSMTWVEMPEIPTEGGREDRLVFDAGPDAVAFGGERWDGSEGELIGDAWILRTGRGAPDAP